MCDVKVGDKVVVVNGAGWSTLRVGDVLKVTMECQPIVLMAKGEISVSTVKTFHSDFELVVEAPKAVTVLPTGKFAIKCTSVEEFNEAQKALFANGKTWHTGDTRIRDYFVEGRSTYLIVAGKTFGYSSGDDGLKVFTLESKTVYTFKTVQKPVPRVKLAGREFSVAEVEAALAKAKEKSFD